MINSSPKLPDIREILRVKPSTSLRYKTPTRFLAVANENIRYEIDAVRNYYFRNQLRFLVKEINLGLLARWQGDVLTCDVRCVISISLLVSILFITICDP